MIFYFVIIIALLSKVKIIPYSLINEAVYSHFIYFLYVIDITISIVNNSTSNNFFIPPNVYIYFQINLAYSFSHL